MTEFRSDAVSENSEETFVKSNSLFDLVRSNLIDDEGGKVLGEPEGSAGSEKITLADIKRPSHHKLENDEDPRPDPKDRPEDLSSITESDGNGSIDTEVLPESQNVVDLNPGNEMAKSLGEGDGFTSGEDTFERSTLVDDAKGVTTQERPIEESDEFQQELLKLQLKFDRQLEDEKQNLEKHYSARLILLRLRWKSKYLTLSFLWHRILLAQRLISSPSLLSKKLRG